jgi:hypothetical protein
LKLVGVDWLPDVVPCRRVLIDEGLRRQDHAVQAEPALRRLLLDERLLYGVRPLGRAEPFEGRDFRSADGADRCHARPDGAAPHDDGAAATLSTVWERPLTWSAMLLMATPLFVLDSTSARGGAYNGHVVGLLPGGSAPVPS